MAGTDALQPSVAPPAAGTSPLDHTGWVIIANALGLVLALVSAGMRLFIRKSIAPPSKEDDVAAWVATAFGVLQATLVFWQVNQGFGKTIDHVPAENLVKVQKIRYAADALYLATIYIAKCSMIFLLIRIIAAPKLQRLLYIGLLVCITFATIAIILVLTRCNPSRPWIQYGEQCTNLFARWQTIAAFDIISELVLFMSPLGFLIKLQMKVQQKMKVVLAFAWRLPIIAFAIIRLYEVSNEINSTDPPLVGALAAVWTQVEMHYSLIATTLPCLTPFLATVNTNFGALELETIKGPSGSSTTDFAHKSKMETTTPRNANNDEVGRAELVRRDENLADLNSPVMRRRSTNTRDKRFQPDSRYSKFKAEYFCGRRSLESSESTQIITRDSAV